MKIIRALLLLVVFSCACLALCQPQKNMVVCWKALLTSSTGDVFGMFTDFDDNDNVYLASKLVTTNQPDQIRIQKFGAYGNLIHILTIPL